METPFAAPGTPVAIQNLDDSAGGGNGGPRRPGNVWTEQAREDVFNRREAGEGWETICPDYPNRSRHAMQQQYSMMKKQRAVAEGTWVSNRRGRKRKTTSGERWASVNKQKLEWEEPEEDDDTQDEDFEEPGLGEFGEGEDTEVNYRQTDQANISQNFRPQLPVRSATDPVFRPPKSKIVTFPNLPNSAGHQHSTHIMRQNGLNLSETSMSNEESGLTANQASYPNKRLKHSPKIGDDSEVLGASSTAVVTFSNLMLDEDEVLDLLERGRQRALATSMYYETERSSQRQIFEAAVSRANKRAYDYEERLRDISYEHAETVKFMQRQQADELQTRKLDYEREQKKRGDLFSSKTEALNRVIQNLQKERENKDNSYAEEIQSLRDELQVVARKHTALPSESSAAIAFSTQLKEQLSNKEEQLRLSEQVRSEMVQKVQELKELQASTVEPILQTKSTYLGLTRKLDQLNHDLEDLSMKALGKAISKIVDDAMEAEKWLLQATKTLDSAHKALSALPARLPIDISQTANGAGDQEVHGVQGFQNINGNNGGHALQPTDNTDGIGNLNSLGSSERYY
ncbi:hypothetical protein MMC32_003259 [Xylographa parallela]|nr:hypothetical protein [Xylographa parallela]